MLTFVNHRRESLIYLEKIGNELHRLVYGLEKLTNGQLSTAIIPARLLHKFLHKILQEVRIQHPQFVPLYTELHHYYESSMNSYSNDKEHIFIQIPIYFVAANQNQWTCLGFRLCQYPWILTLIRVKNPNIQHWKCSTNT